MHPSLIGIVSVALLSALPMLARAQLDCIVPTREEGFDARQSGAAELQRAARAVVAIVQRNTVFMAGNKPVRVRSSINYYGWGRQQASVITTAYNQTAWLAGGCKVSKFADRGGGLADGTVAVFINDPESLLGGRLGDAELRASRAPKPLGSAAGFPVYGAGGNDDGPVLLISRSDYRPWVPVTVAEMLEWRERELSAREREHAAAMRTSGDGLSEASIEESYRSMKKVNAAEAEKMRTQMLAVLANVRAESAKQSSRASAWAAEQRQAFDAYRASFTPEQLAAQGTISNSVTRAKVIRVDDPAGTPLAKVDPAYAHRDPNGIQLIVVSRALQPKTDPEYAWFEASLDALDYAALGHLLKP